MRFLITALPAVLLLASCVTPASRQHPTEGGVLGRRLPTGVYLDPAGRSVDVGSMPLAMVMAPEGDRVVILLNGWREQGIQVVDRASGRILQTLTQPAAFLGLAFAPDGRSLFVSGGNQDVVYRYDWRDGRATLADSLMLASTDSAKRGTRYPSGLALSPDGRTLYVAENLADSLAVIDVASKRIVVRLAAGRYPYGVVVAPDGSVYTSAWGGKTVSVFTPRGGTLVEDAVVTVGRHPSALLLNADGSRLYITSGSTDRITLMDTRKRSLIGELRDPPGSTTGFAPGGSTPNALALSADETRLYVAEADNNAVAVFDLAGGRTDAPVARIPVGWYPTALLIAGDSLLVVNGKGRGTAPNVDGPQPGRPSTGGSRAYTLGQTSGTLTTVAARPSANVLSSLTSRVERANGWHTRTPLSSAYPPFQHVIYIIKENRTYDQILGDMPEGDGDTSLVLFPREVTPNHHALAERFGLFDRFFVNAEVSADGHNWSMAAYTTDYVQKTTPSNYSNRGRSYDYEGTNRGVIPPPGEDVAEPANGYLWDLAQRAGTTFRNYGEFVIPEGVDTSEKMPAGYRGTKPFLAAHTNTEFPGYDLDITDQRRADVWIAELQRFVREGNFPALSILRLPNDHTAGARAGKPTPRAYVADNDLALGRVVEAFSRTPFWRNSVIFVIEDDAQNGPDHVDSHRSPLLVISPYNRPGVNHRFANTTDVIATIAEILKLGSLSQFDFYGRPLREIFHGEPDFTPYTTLVPSVDLNERNAARSPGASESEALDLRFEDSSDDELFNRILWKAVKGENVPYPGASRMSALEWKRGR